LSKYIYLIHLPNNIYSLSEDLNFVKQFD